MNLALQLVVAAVLYTNVPPAWPLDLPPAMAERASLMPGAAVSAPPTPGISVINLTNKWVILSNGVTIAEASAGAQPPADIALPPRAKRLELAKAPLTRDSTFDTAPPLPGSRIFPIPPRLQTLVTRLPLPGGGLQTFRALVPRGARPASTNASASISLTLESEGGATTYRVESSSNLVHWAAAGVIATNRTAVVDGTGLPFNFWRLVPVSAAAPALKAARLAALPPPPPVPLQTPYRSGCIPTLYVPSIPGFYTGIQLGPVWSFGLDYEGEDVVLLNTNDESPVFDGMSGDLIRISANRRYRFGPASGTPKHEPATYTFEVNPDTPTGIRLKPWREAPVALDALDLRQSSDADRRWLLFGQGDGRYDFRLGYVRDALCIYSAGGTPGATPAQPGKLIFKLWPNGDFWTAGRQLTEPK